MAAALAAGQLEADAAADIAVAVEHVVVTEGQRRSRRQRLDSGSRRACQCVPPQSLGG
jgi:hypothetical protein